MPKALQLLLAIALALVVVLAAILVLFPEKELPSDAELERVFREHRSDFDALVALKEGEDALLILAKIGLKTSSGSPWHRDSDGTVWIDYCNRFRMVDSKGYVYSPSKEPSPLFESLDKAPALPGREPSVPVFKRIDKGWYIFYTSDD